jgi:hypothetical protein
VKLIQGVGRRIELTDPPALPSDVLIGRVVVIRRRTDVEA